MARRNPLTELALILLFSGAAAVVVTVASDGPRSRPNQSRSAVTTAKVPAEPAPKVEKAPRLRAYTLAPANPTPPPRKPVVSAKKLQAPPAASRQKPPSVATVTVATKPAGAKTQAVKPRSGTVATKKVVARTTEKPTTKAAPIAAPKTPANTKPSSPVAASKPAARVPAPRVAAKPAPAAAPQKVYGSDRVDPRLRDILTRRRAVASASTGSGADERVRAILSARGRP